MTLAIAQLGQPVLRKVAEEIPAAEIGSPEFQRFIDDMQATVQENKGAGLAGPQVFASRRVFLAKVLPAKQEDGEREFDVFINPKITPLTREQVLGWEGCLSFPELLVLVPRVRVARVEYLNRHGEHKSLELEGWPARIVLHEYDHLDGILTIDRAPNTRYIIKGSEVEAAMEELDKE
jgi:peptide deformylase